MLSILMKIFCNIKTNKILLEIMMFDCLIIKIILLRVF